MPLTREVELEIARTLRGLLDLDHYVAGRDGHSLEQHHAIERAFKAYRHALSAREK